MSKRRAQPQLAVEYRSIDDLIPYARNARRHSRAQIKKLQRSLEKFGWTNPLLVDDDGNLVCGHGRLEAARLNGETVVPVINLGEMSEADRRAYIIADNRLAEDAEWSKDLLRSELSGLIELGYDIELTGFDTFEVDGILSFGDDAEAEEIVELPAEDAGAICRDGDIWTSGEQTLGVGDCRDKALLAKVLGQDRVRLVMTDPPYGNRIANNVSGNGKVRHGNFRVGSGEQSLPDFAETLIKASFEAIVPYCHAGSLAYVFTDWRAAPYMHGAALNVFAEPKNLIVWVKNPGMGGFYRSAHELCWIFKISAGKHVSNVALGQRNRTNVWRYPSVNTFRKGRMEDLADHPTIKNRRMVADAILDVTKPNDVVFDGFAGSGTTLCACAMTGRRGMGIELDPKYADVILRRLAEVTGCEPLLDGVTPLSEVAAARQGGER